MKGRVLMASQTTTDIKSKIDYCDQMINILNGEIKIKTLELAKMRSKLVYGESVDVSDYSKTSQDIEILSRRLMEYGSTLKSLSSNLDFTELIDENFFNKVNKRVDFVDVDYPKSATVSTDLVISFGVKNIGMDKLDGKNKVVVNVTSKELNYSESHSVILNLDTLPREISLSNITIQCPPNEGLYDIKITMMDDISENPYTYDYSYMNMLVVTAL